jgi:hypothetical protein
MRSRCANSPVDRFSPEPSGLGLFQLYGFRAVHRLENTGRKSPDMLGGGSRTSQPFSMSWPSSSVAGVGRFSKQLLSRLSPFPGVTPSFSSRLSPSDSSHRSAALMTPMSIPLSVPAILMMGIIGASSGILRKLSIAICLNFSGI